MEQIESFAALEAQVARLAEMAGNLENTIAAMEQRVALGESGEVERVTATVDEAEEKVQALETRLAEAERQIAALQAAAAPALNGPAQVGRKTQGSGAAQLLAKHGIGEGTTDVAALDAALTSLPIEQRIAVKSQLLRAGLLG